MTSEQFVELVAEGDPDKLMTIMEGQALVKDIQLAINQFLPEKHGVMDTSVRRNKSVKDADGNEKTVTVNRLALPLQKNIVTTAAAFLGNPVYDCTTSNPAEEKLLKALQKTADDNKLEYKFRSIAKFTMSEKHCAELWYTQDAEPEYWTDIQVASKSRLRMRVLAHSLGDTLFPLFDGFGDMIAFGRAYDVKEVVDGKEVINKHFDLYTAETITYMIKPGGGDWIITPFPNPFKKIPVVYYWQPYTEWADVQTLIDRLETKISNHADTNDYYDSPIVFAEGAVTGFADKGEQGKLLQGENGAKVSYLTWDSAPESMKMEINNLLEHIYKLTNTPDISFESMKGLGAFSGIAIKLMFLGAHLKASDKEEIFGEGVQRRINYQKAAFAVMDSSLAAAAPMKVKPKFTYFLPENVQEQIAVLVAAASAKILSRETAIEQNPLIGDVDEEKRRITEADLNKGTEPLAISLGVGGTQALQAIVTDPRLSVDSKRNILQILFNITPVDSIRMVPDEQPRPTPPAPFVPPVPQPE